MYSVIALKAFSLSMPFRLNLFLALASGLLVPIAFSPTDYPLVLFLSFSSLFLLYQTQTPKRAFLTGWFFGIGMFGLGVSWVFVSIHEFGHVPFLLSALITLIFIFFLALFIGLQGYLLMLIAPNHNLMGAFSFATLWVFFEWLREWFLTGFPWLYIGYSQTDTVFKGFIPLIGVFGLSFLIVYISSLLTFFLKWKSPIGTKLFSMAFILLCTICGFYLKDIPWTQSQNRQLKVTTIQGNIPQDLKWSSNYLHKTLKTYQMLTKKHWESELIVWPEAAVPLLMHYAKPFLNILEKAAYKNKSMLLLGIPVKNKDGNYYNALLSIGKSKGIYYKRHLVPFGEYTPFKTILGGILDTLKIPMSNFSAGPANQKNFLLGDIQIAPFICYEIAYANALLDERKNAHILVTASNDAWFGNSLAPYQHLQIARVRSLQTGKHHITSTNDGISAFIDPFGNILAQSPPFIETTLTYNIPITSGFTPWVKYGHHFVSVLFFLYIFIWIFLRMKRNILKK